jgi:hypothetical protein
MDIQNGYLFITDITGYTELLIQSELDALFDSIPHHLNPPIVISRTQNPAAQAGRAAL